MSNTFSVINYNSEYESLWDQFVMNNSINGSFLQSRNFLNYHEREKYIDCSLLIRKGNEIVAVVPATSSFESGRKVFVSHQGSTFGGIVISRNIMKVSSLEELFNALNDYFISNGFNTVIMKQTGRIYCNEEMDLLDYFYYYKGFTSCLEIGYYIDYMHYDKDITKNFTSSRRRDYKYSLKYNYCFKEISSNKEIEEFYSVLCDNYTKFQKKPIHSCEELIEFKEKRLKNIVRFFGVFMEDKMVAGAMVFCFKNQVFHTQYLAVNQNMLKCFINEFLYTSLIEKAQSESFKYLSLGTSTFNRGKQLNVNLAQYKEGYGTKQYNNVTFIKSFEVKDDG